MATQTELNNVEINQNNEQEKKKNLILFYELIKEEDLSIDLQLFLERQCKNLPKNTKINNVDLLSLSIYYGNKSCFDILLENDYDVNASLDTSQNRGMVPIFWAINTNNNYFINKLLEKENIDLFHKTPCNNNILTYLCQYNNNIDTFEKVLKILKKNQ